MNDGGVNVLNGRLRLACENDEKIIVGNRAKNAFAIEEHGAYTFYTEA